jgi:hypothetical protein
MTAEAYGGVGGSRRTAIGPIIFNDEGGRLNLPSAGVHELDVLAFDVVNGLDLLLHRHRS